MRRKKIKEFPELHQQGLISLENLQGFISNIKSNFQYITGDLGVKITEDGRVWICVNGVALLRFRPLSNLKEKEK